MSNNITLLKQLDLCEDAMKIARNYLGFAHPDLNLLFDKILKALEEFEKERISK